MRLVASTSWTDGPFDLCSRGASPLAGYAVVFGVGVLAGLMGLLFLARIPEPRMPPSVRRPWRDVFRTPLTDAGFRPVMIFLACWTFAANLTAPFFTVYLLRRFGLPMAWIVGLTVLSQSMTALAFRWWGAMADRFDLRTVLRVAGAAYNLDQPRLRLPQLLHRRPRRLPGRDVVA